jgi:hypothetical protein
MDVVLLDISCPPGAIGQALKALSEDLTNLPVPWVRKHHLVVSARIPVLKLQSISGVPVDITIASTTIHTGLRARDLVLGFCQQAPQIKPLVLVLKTFLRSLSLNDPYTGGISSYCIVVLLHMFWTEAYLRGICDTTDCGTLLMTFLPAFIQKFEGQLTHVDDPLSPPVIAENGQLLQPSENIMQSCYQISRLCTMFRKAHDAMHPNNPDVGPWEQYEGKLLDALFALAGRTSSTQTEPPLMRSGPELDRAGGGAADGPKPGAAVAGALLGGGAPAPKLERPRAMQAQAATQTGVPHTTQTGAQTEGVGTVDSGVGTANVTESSNSVGVGTSASTSTSASASTSASISASISTPARTSASTSLGTSVGAELGADGLPVAACDERVSTEGIDATEVAAREVTAAVVATATSFVTADYVTANTVTKSADGAAAKDDSSCAQVPASAIVGATSSPTSSPDSPNMHPSTNVPKVPGGGSAQGSAQGSALRTPPVQQSHAPTSKPQAPSLMLPPSAYVPPTATQPASPQPPARPSSATGRRSANAPATAPPRPSSASGAGGGGGASGGGEGGSLSARHDLEG